MDELDRALEAAIREGVRSRASVCPSEAARAVGGEGWRALMEPVRRVARRLVEAGEVEITQKGRVVDPDTARGPIRIRARQPPQPQAPASHGSASRTTAAKRGSSK